MQKKPIYLIDLTHDTPLGMGSDTMPMQLGLIAAYCLKVWGDKVDIKIFKFVDEFNEAVKEQPPFILGVSNYVWNIDLSYQVASKIKQKYPETVVVFGGPNYPDVYEEQVEWLKEFPNVDFFVFRDGETPFARLVGRFLDGADIRTVQREALPSCHAIVDGEPFFGNLEARLITLEEIPSPYVMGLMDKFFEQKLIPAVRTNRGCPFTCTFCAEGHSYYTKVFKTSYERKKEEIDYIVSRIKHTKTLRIADSNFGMFEEDVEFCRYLSEVQARTGYPEYVNCATGKNRKELVLECNRLLRGAMRFTASVQSLNPEVLDNVKRKNISLDDIMNLSDQISDTPTHAYSEIILALPSDSLNAEKETMSGLIKAGIGNITQHQLSIIPGTEIAAKTTREKFGMKSRFRPIQRCLGKYKILDEEFISIEIEEVCVESNTLSFEDYLEARRLYLTIGLFYNDRIFGEIHGLLRLLHLPTWDWMMRIHNSINAAPPEIQAMYNDFTSETIGELWPDRGSLIADVSKKLDQYVAGEAGGNLIYKYRARAMVQHFTQLHAVAFDALRGFIEEHNLSLDNQVREIERFSRYQKNQIFDTDFLADEEFGIDIVRLIKEPELARKGSGIEALSYPTRIRIAHSESQKASIRREINFYGGDLGGLTMLLSRYPVKRFYRNADVAK